MTIHASNPFDSYKFAIRTALGGNGEFRPIFKERGIDSITLAGEREDFFFLFESFNNDYINSLPTEDITVFTEEQYGKFFYEYGRTLLGNLSICLTKADWNSVDYNFDGGAASYVGEYYHALITLKDKISGVIEQFRKEAVGDTYSKHNFNFELIADEIIKQKEIVSQSKESADMRNSKIFLISYIGIMFVLYGMLILVSQSLSERNIFTFFKAPQSTQSNKIFTELFVESNIGAEERQHIMTLMYVFWKTTNFYKRVSGFEELDGVIGTLYDFVNRVISKLDGTDESAEKLKDLLDKDLIDESFANGLSIQTFTDNYDIFENMLYFKSATIIENDYCNIFGFGKEYIYHYDMKDDEDNRIEEKTMSPIRSYIKSSLKSRYSNEDIEKIFTEVKNILTGVEVDDLAKVNPGIILWLCLLASCFRTIQLRKTERSNTAHNEINGAIDILDILIIKLYDTWFHSKKYYIQSKRPNYTQSDGARSSLAILRGEIDEIIMDYLEFVRFGLSDNISDEDKHLYINTREKLLYAYLYGNEKYWTSDKVEEVFPISNGTDGFVRNCAEKNGRSIVQTVFKEGAFSAIVMLYRDFELPKYIIKSLSIEPDHNYTGISAIDRVINVAHGEINNTTEDMPKMYMLFDYALLWVAIDGILKKYNVGNYFDFGDPDNSLQNYSIEKVVASKVAHKIQTSINLNRL